MEQDKPSHPIDISLLGADTIVLDPQAASELVEKLW
jgi:hypothetical protein